MRVEGMNRALERAFTQCAVHSAFRTLVELVLAEILRNQSLAAGVAGNGPKQTQLHVRREFLG
jgi:hypothetical protein